MVEVVDDPRREQLAELTTRWQNERDLEWREVRPELVVEVTFDHVSDGRIRHGAKIQRWREDKDPAECRIDQLAS